MTPPLNYFTCMVIMKEYVLNPFFFGAFNRVWLYMKFSSIGEFSYVPQSV
jgi:hypothetical protein